MQIVYFLNISSVPLLQFSLSSIYVIFGSLYIRSEYFLKFVVKVLFMYLFIWICDICVYVYVCVFLLWFWGLNPGLFYHWSTFPACFIFLFWDMISLNCPQTFNPTSFKSIFGSILSIHIHEIIIIFKKLKIIVPPPVFLMSFLPVVLCLRRKQQKDSWKLWLSCWTMLKMTCFMKWLGSDCISYVLLHNKLPHN